MAADDLSFADLSRELCEEAWRDTGDLFDQTAAELRAGVPEPARSDPSRDMLAVLVVLGALAFGVVKL